MRFLLFKKKTKKEKEFSEKEWALADIEHFGEPYHWKEEGFYIKAVDKGEIVGLIHYEVKAGVMEISTFIVSHSKRNEGIGSMLLQKVEKVAKTNNIHKLFLVTGKGWKAEKFYQKNGFVKSGILKNHFLHKDWTIYSKYM